jgi:hypothetical protein
VIVRYVQDLSVLGIPTIRNDAVTSATTTSATFNGMLTSTGSSACAVCVYWGTDTNAWANTNWFNGGAVNSDWTNNTPFSTNITLPTPGVTYYYTYGASNTTTNVVASGPVSFGPPAVTVAGATVTGPTTATLNGRLTTSNGLPTTVFFCWGTNDYLTASTNDWPNIVNCGPAADGQSFSNNITGLTNDVRYWYRAYATNANSAGWSSSTNFLIELMGGTKVSYVDAGGTGWVAHIFTTVGADRLVVGASNDVEVLVVGGGGAGGGYVGGGGGGGGVIVTNLTLGTGAYDITVGAGGTTSNGSNSVFGSLTAYGGGRGAIGGGISTRAATAGGSGGGGGSAGGNVTGGGYTNGQGFAGGTSPGGGGIYPSAGGGGAGGPGGSPLNTSSPGGNGGPGVTNAMSGWAIVYGGGGGGASVNAQAAGGNGDGGGLSSVGAAVTQNGSAGKANTGGGGGGGGSIEIGTDSQWPGGAGIVIVRYRQAVSARQVQAAGGDWTNAAVKGYLIHVFTNVGSSTFTVTTAGKADVLLVGGGGPGGGYVGGGGGGGGVLYYSNLMLAAGAYTVEVGAGGTTVKGSNSVFRSVSGSLIAYGGGRGASGGASSTRGSREGASGGGGGSGTTGVRPGSYGINGQGFSGGTSPGASGTYPSAGGGGAGGAGGSPATTSAPGGDGGPGVTNAITGTNVVYGGGGGGASLNAQAAGGNGDGGGLSSVGEPVTQNGTAGKANTGGGGGGGGSTGNGDFQWPGGAGIVVIRYEVFPKGTSFMFR